MFFVSEHAEKTMQLPLPIDDTAWKLAGIHTRLLEHFGPLPLCWHPPPLWQLIFALVGKETRGDKSNAASLQLFRKFRTPSHIMDAPVEEIRKAIYNVKRPDEKAREIKTALAQIVQRRGDLALDFLAGWPEEDAMRWLECDMAGRQYRRFRFSWRHLNLHRLCRSSR